MPISGKSSAGVDCRREKDRSEGWPREAWLGLKPGERRRMFS